jgi:hypothetical protein
LERSTSGKQNCQRYKAQKYNDRVPSSGTDIALYYTQIFRLKLQPM